MSLAEEKVLEPPKVLQIVFWCCAKHGRRNEELAEFCEGFRAKRKDPNCRSALLWATVQVLSMLWYGPVRMGLEIGRWIAIATQLL